MSNHENCSVVKSAFRLDHVGSFLRPERQKKPVRSLMPEKSLPKNSNALKTKKSLP